MTAVCNQPSVCVARYKVVAMLLESWKWSQVDPPEVAELPYCRIPRSGSAAILFNQWVQFYRKGFDETITINPLCIFTE